MATNAVSLFAVMMTKLFEPILIVIVASAHEQMLWINTQFIVAMMTDT